MKKILWIWILSKNYWNILWFSWGILIQNSCLDKKKEILHLFYKTISFLIWSTAIWVENWFFHKFLHLILIFLSVSIFLKSDDNFSSNSSMELLSINSPIWYLRIISLRSLLEILSRLGGKYYPPRGKKVVKIIKEILNQTFKKSTLHGCIIEKFGNLTLIYKENEKKI